MAHGVSVEVVPGITAALGCAASAMIPLTHRGLATSVRFVTGHCRAGWWLDLDWSSLADPKTTLVFYMASLHLDEIVLHLVAAGLDPETPAAAISSGTTGEERLLRAPLHALRTALECRPLPSPVLFVIGPVVDALTSKDRTKHPVAMPIGTLLAHVAHA